ncbi:Tctex-1 [Xylogone sp. PMI_703]|nr:Tctex-1 [Xylogone sp. PMI_703]
MSTPSTSSTPPVSFTRLKQIATDACQSALGSAEFYEHSKTEGWNSAIINSILKALISESSPPGGTPAYKFAVNSTIIQHLVPTSALSKPKPASPPTEGSATETTPHAGRRGMHSASGCYWNEKTDGMWSFKYEGGEDKGLDIVISVIWIGL